MIHAADMVSFFFFIICKWLAIKDEHSVRNNMRCQHEIGCAGCVKCDAQGAHV